MQRIKTHQHAKKQPSYQQVVNQKGQRCRGLWTKRGHFYAQLTANNGVKYRYPLDVQTIPDAVLAQQALKMKQKAGTLPPPGVVPEKEAPISKKEAQEGCPTLTELVKEYQTDRDLGRKSVGSGKREDSGLQLWCNIFGSRPVVSMGAPELSVFAKWRKKPKTRKLKSGKLGETITVSGRAIDLDVLALQHVYEFGRKQKLIPEDFHPFSWSALADPPAKDELLSDEQMDQLCNAALLAPEKLELIPKKYRHLRAAQVISGQLFYDYLRLLQHTGAREHESSLQRWEYVTWSTPEKRGNILFPGKNTKSGGGQPAPDRWIPMSKKLEAHLLEMYSRRDGDGWMFPSEKGGPIHRFYKNMATVKKSLRKNWLLSATPAELKEEKEQKKKNLKPSRWFDRVTFQWFRHYFISHCVMAGMDFKTIATWVSHRDGGILIGKLYGHLNAAHHDNMAARLDEFQQ